MSPNPILRALSSIRKSGARTLLMGGQACIFYGAAEFSRDLDLLVPGRRRKSRAPASGSTTSKRSRSRRLISKSNISNAGMRFIFAANRRSERDHHDQIVPVVRLCRPRRRMRRAPLASFACRGLPEFGTVTPRGAERLRRRDRPVGRPERSENRSAARGAASRRR